MSKTSQPWQHATDNVGALNSAPTTHVNGGEFLLDKNANASVEAMRSTHKPDVPPMTIAEGDKELSTPTWRKGPTPEEISAELDKMKLDPKTRDVADQFSKALQGDNLKEMVDGFAEIVKKYGDDPETLKKGVDAICDAFRKNGVSLDMQVGKDGSLIIGEGTLVVHPDGKIEVHPLSQPG